ncbi:uncharacterized protein RSE6_12801 [Rhynchosporium secalis]|uniref:Uncharacterized protein n=1 Tax=Rhynchosporium secalis TaxID=38038 RepID=A0A1E1MRF1_RHYSE|nr:uncharacterized protein RSE6_12801 [Rhynchosporium secalis]
MKKVSQRVKQTKDESVRLDRVSVCHHVMSTEHISDDGDANAMAIQASQLAHMLVRCESACLQVHADIRLVSGNVKMGDDLAIDRADKEKPAGSRPALIAPCRN